MIRPKAILLLDIKVRVQFTSRYFDREVRMRVLIRLPWILMMVFGIAGGVFAQDNEPRQGTGLPTLIGENSARGTRMNVSGRITLETVTKPKQLPVITVSVLVSGSNAEKAIANDTGYYLIKNVPRDNATLLVEIDGNEVVRQPIVASAMGNPRFDYSIPWPAPAPPAKP